MGLAAQGLAGLAAQWLAGLAAQGLAGLAAQGLAAHGFMGLAAQGLAAFILPFFFSGAQGLAAHGFIDFAAQGLAATSAAATGSENATALRAASPRESALRDSVCMINPFNQVRIGTNSHSRP